MQGWRRSTPATAFRGGARSCSPESSNLGPPGVKTTGTWVRKELRGMHDSPGPKAGHGKALGRSCDGGGGSEWRRSPARASLGSSGLGFRHEDARACADGYLEGNVARVRLSRDAAMSAMAGSRCGSPVTGVPAPVLIKVP